MRLAIDITPEQHQRLEAAAALQGKTIKDYVLERALTGLGDAGQADLRTLEILLNTRIEAAKAGVSDKSVSDIANAVLKTEAGANARSMTLPSRQRMTAQWSITPIDGLTLGTEMPILFTLWLKAVPHRVSQAP